LTTAGRCGERGADSAAGGGRRHDHRSPLGLEDLFALRLRPNPLRQIAGFARTAEATLRRWPEVTVIG
jgi:hypothetical protein